MFSILLILGLNFLIVGIPIGYHIMTQNNTFCTIENLIICVPIYFLGMTILLTEVGFCIYFMHYCCTSDVKYNETYDSSGDYISNLQDELHNLDD